MPLDIAKGLVDPSRTLIYTTISNFEAPIIPDRFNSGMISQGHALVSPPHRGVHEISPEMPTTHRP